MRSNYYQAGDNYGRAGNYAYQAGGIFGSFGKVLGGIVKTAAGFLPGPAGAIAKGVISLTKGGGGGPALPVIRTPGLRGFTERLLPGGATGYQVGTGFGGRRRMNAMNVKALRRASRRIDSFTRTARKALKHTGYMIVSRSARRGVGGSRGVITRSEAARALKR